MHSFSELVDRSTSFTLKALREAEQRVVDTMRTSAASGLVKSLQMIQLQKAITAVGMFSIFEAMLQDRQAGRNGFTEARRCLEQQGEEALARRFLLFTYAVNVLKHGHGRSYEALLAEGEALPFRLKRPDEHFFFEGDVSEVSMLIQVDDAFVLGCAEIISEVSAALARAGEPV